MPDATAMLGAIDPTRAVEITNAYLVAFFDRYLAGAPSALLGGPSSDYPEVLFYKQP